MKLIIVSVLLIGPCKPGEVVTVAGECGRVVDAARPVTPEESWQYLIEMDDGSLVSTAADWVRVGCHREED